MKWRPTWSERLARPAGLAPSAERRRIAAEFTAPADRTTIPAATFLDAPRLPNMDRRDAPASGRRFQMLDPRAGLDADVVVRERRRERAGLRVHLARPGVGVSVPRGPPAREPAVDVDAEGKGERMQSLPLQPLANARDRRFVGDGRMRVRRRVRRLGRVLAEAPAHPGRAPPARPYQGSSSRRERAMPAIRPPGAPAPRSPRAGNGTARLHRASSCRRRSRSCRD